MVHVIIHQIFRVRLEFGKLEKDFVEFGNILEFVECVRTNYEKIFVTDKSQIFRFVAEFFCAFAVRNRVYVLYFDKY